MRHDTKTYQYKYQLMKENCQELMIFFNETGIITDCNRFAEQALGYEKELIGVSIWEIFKKSFRYEEDRLVILPKFIDSAAETVAYRKNQTCFAVYLKVVTTGSGKYFVGLCIAKDFSEKKRNLREIRHLKHELKLAKEYKNEFVANITHELKTPVNGIKGLTENLLETELTPKQLETLNIIHRCCDNMNILINNLLDITKIGSKKLVLEKRSFHFRRFINDIINFNIPEINEKGLKLIVNISNDVPDIVVGDECRLAQILNNLLSNAIKFTAVGQIALEVVKTSQTEDEAELFFMVMDTGIGISLKDRDKLFQSFTQVDSSITRRFGGSGLGLSICSMLVKAMHGNITVESEVNKGSTFSFTVRLGVAKDSDLEDGEYWNLNHYEAVEDRKEPWESKQDFLSHLLEEANISMLQNPPGNLASEAREKGAKNRMEQDIKDSVERLMLCFDMGNWIKAEEIAYSLKRLIPEEYNDIRNKALQLLISIRKEDQKNSVRELNELVNMLKEMAAWNV